MILEDGKYNYMIDIDGTLGDDIDNSNIEGMIDAKVYPNAVEEINRLYNDGHIITIFTARTSAEHKDVTETWLKKHGFKYHILLMDKPRFGSYRWIDNHSVEGLKFDNLNLEQEWTRIGNNLNNPGPKFEITKIKDKILVLPMTYERIDGYSIFIEKRLKDFNNGSIVIDTLLCNGITDYRFIEFEVDHEKHKVLWHTAKNISDSVDIDINYYANKHYSYHLDLVKNSSFIYEHHNIEQLLTGKRHD